MADNIPDLEDILAQMKEKFLETAQDKLDRLNEILQAFSGGNSTDESLRDEFFREIHSLKGMGGTFQMPLITKLCHAFEAFLEGETKFDQNLIVASHVYVDRISDLVETGEAGDENKLDSWLDGLPQKGDDAVVSQNDKQSAFIISQNSEHIAIVDASFSQSGFTVLSFLSPFSAFQKSFEDTPQIIVVSQNGCDLDGAEFIRSLKATRALSKSKFAMICPDRRKALEENLDGVQLLSEKNIENDILNFIAIAVTA